MYLVYLRKSAFPLHLQLALYDNQSMDSASGEGLQVGPSSSGVTPLGLGDQQGRLSEGIDLEATGEGC